MQKKILFLHFCISSVIELKVCQVESLTKNVEFTLEWTQLDSF